MDTKEHYLYPAAIYASSTPTKVTTVLGTCIAVCLWDSKLKIGGINHFMLPFWNGEGLASPKYGNIAIKKLIEKLTSLGSEKENLVAKIFGGKEGEHNDTFKIGSRNATYAIDALNDQNISVVAKSVGGNYGRKILFDTSTGEVLMKYIKPSNPTPNQ